MQKNQTNKKILIVEDDISLRFSIRVFLENLNCRVIETDTIQEAFKFAYATQPDLILIDLNLPGNSAFDAIEIIRQTSRLRDIPILTTSDDGQRGIQLYLNIDKLGQGLIEYLTKPLSFDELAFHIESILS